MSLLLAWDYAEGGWTCVFPRTKQQPLGAPPSTRSCIYGWVKATASLKSIWSPINTNPSNLFNISFTSKKLCVKAGEMYGVCVCVMARWCLRVITYYCTSWKIQKLGFEVSSLQLWTKIFFVFWNRFGWKTFWERWSLLVCCMNKKTIQQIESSLVMLSIETRAIVATGRRCRLAQTSIYGVTVDMTKWGVLLLFVV